MRALAALILQGRSEAVAVVACAAGAALFLPPLIVVSAAALALVTLHSGMREALWVMGLAVVALVVVGIVTPVGPELGAKLVALWLPTSVLAWVFRCTESLARTLEVLVVWAALGVLGAYWLLGDPASLEFESIKASFRQIAEVAQTDMDASASAETLRNFSRYMLTGLLASSFASSFFLGFFLGWWWHALLADSRGVTDDFVNVRLHPWFGGAGVALIVAAMVQDGKMQEIACNLIVPFCVLFSIAGVAVLHSLISAKAGKGFLLFGVYFVFLVVPYAIVPMAVIGVTDVWMDWRNRSSAGLMG